MTEAYYYSTLSKEHQGAYRAMQEGFMALADSFMAPRLEGRSLYDVFFLMRLDHPEIFYVESISYRYYENSNMVEVVPDYLFKKKIIKENQRAMKSRIEKLARPAIAMKDEEKLKYIHDFICGNITYDKLKKQYSHEIIGPLGHGVGVCEGISKSVKILCDALNIQSLIAISSANIDKGIKYRHAWNIVKIGKKWYHLDATFDNSLGRVNEIRYDYYMLGDKQVFRDHEPVIWSVPECSDNVNFYYKQSKLSFTKLEDIAKRSAQAVRKGKVFIFQWRGGYMNRELVGEFAGIIHKSAADRGKHSIMSVNMAQGVVRAEFTDKPADSDLLIEEADEGNNL